MPARFLVNAPANVDFLESLMIESGLDRQFGKIPDDLDPMVRADVQSARIQLQHAAKQVVALASDPTRTDVDKHVAARRVAEATNATLAKASELVSRRAEHQRRDAMAKANQDFSPLVEKGTLYMEARSMVREWMKTSEGLQKLREAMKEDHDFASVVWHSPRHLLGLQAEIHSNLKMEGLQARRPDLYGQLNASLRLEKMAQKIGSVIPKVNASFYNPVTAAQGAKRVEVP